jgi:GAF domain-containing protein
MWRFVLTENIRRFEMLIAQEESESRRERLRELIEQERAELNELERVSTPEVARRDAALKYFAEHSVDEAVRLHHSQFGTLQVYDETRESLFILAQRNLRAPFLVHLALVKPSDGSACGRCLQERRQAVIRNVSGDPAFEPHLKAAQEAGIQAIQACPVPDGAGELIAVLSTYFTTPQDFSHDQLDQIAKFAVSVGAGLEKHVYA